MDVLAPFYKYATRPARERDGAGHQQVGRGHATLLQALRSNELDEVMPHFKLPSNERDEVMPHFKLRSNERDEVMPHFKLPSNERDEVMPHFKLPSNEED